MSGANVDLTSAPLIFFLILNSSFAHLAASPS